MFDSAKSSLPYTEDFGQKPSHHKKQSQIGQVLTNGGTRAKAQQRGVNAGNSKRIEPRINVTRKSAPEPNMNALRAATRKERGKLLSNYRP
jgi:hypothetical protein